MRPVGFWGAETPVRWADRSARAGDRSCQICRLTARHFNNVQTAGQILIPRNPGRFRRFRQYRSPVDRAGDAHHKQSVPIDLEQREQLLMQ